MSAQLFDVTFVSVSGVFGYDDSEGAYRQTALKAVSVSARSAGSQLTWKREGDDISCPYSVNVQLTDFIFGWGGHIFLINVLCLKVRTTALAFLKRMYEKDQLRDYIEKFALNYMQLLVHPNPPSLLFGADKDTGL